jgi:hypothetical protein
VCGAREILRFQHAVKSKGQIPSFSYILEPLHAENLQGHIQNAANLIVMNHPSLTPRVHEALRDEALLKEVNDEMRKLTVDEIAYVCDCVRFSCPPCPS